MIKFIALVLLTFCFGSLDLCAQEIAGQGWTVPEARSRSSNTISPAVTGNIHNSDRPSSETFVPVIVQKGNGKDPAPPFPVLMPKAIMYPRKAIRRGWEGKTVVAAEVLPDGSVGRTALARSSGHGILDNAAQESIKTWKFGPVQEEEAAVPQFVDIPVTFKLEDHGEG